MHSRSDRLRIPQAQQPDFPDHKQCLESSLIRLQPLTRAAVEGRAVMRHAAKVRTVAAGAALLGLVLSGCSALQIRTAERDSGPLRVAVEEKAGENPTTAPPEDGIPDGMKEVSVNLGAECPVDVSLAMTDDWTESSVTDEFHSFSRGTSMADSDMTLITCTQGL